MATYFTKLGEQFTEPIHRIALNYTIESYFEYNRTHLLVYKLIK